MEDDIKKAILFAIANMNAKHDLNYDEHKAIKLADELLVDFNEFAKANEADKKSKIILLKH